MDIWSGLITGVITLIAAFGGGYLGHRLQRERDKAEYDRRRQDNADDAERAALINMINACGGLNKALTSIAVRSNHFVPHSQFQGVIVPTEDLLIFEEAKAEFVTTYTILKSDKLAETAAAALQASYDALISVTTNDLNDLQGPLSLATYKIGSVAVWARLMYYGRSILIDWNKPPFKLSPMSNHPLEAMFRAGKLRAHRPGAPIQMTDSDSPG
ncbi:MAG: hypothetical protein ACR2KM_12060 [Gemmatimonadaceae bacterium]